MNIFFYCDVTEIDNCWMWYNSYSSLRNRSMGESQTDTNFFSFVQSFHFNPKLVNFIPNLTKKLFCFQIWIRSHFSYGLLCNWSQSLEQARGYEMFSKSEHLNWQQHALQSISFQWKWYALYLTSNMSASKKKTCNHHRLI